MRQLAAILFADMVGYTALMQQNETLAREKRRRLKDVLEETVSLHHGKILQYYGDGSLSIFNSAIDGVSCAIELQKSLQKEPKVDLRIGIHTGDVTIEEDSIYGDGVNLASRIESLAVPGGIFISEKVYDEIKNQENITAQEIGYFELKNITQPVHVYAISNNGVTVPRRQELEGKTKAPVNRLAVLPFVNMSADPENEYFSDGITEELLNALTKVDGLQVTSRTSAFAFKGKHDDVREIGVKLNVDKVLEGSVRKAGNRVRITAQLINAIDGYHIWSENYDRSLTDIFEVQDEISGIIANRLRENLSAAHKHFVKAPTQNMEAYTLYLKGLHFWNKLTPADARKAMEQWEKVLELEPDYAQAYAMLANAYSYLGATGQTTPSKAFEIAQRYSSKALGLNNDIAEGHIAKACSYLFYEWKWKEAKEELETAIHLNPAAVYAYQILAFYYVMSGRREEAVAVMEKAKLIDPLSPVINHYIGEVYLANDRYTDALHQAEKILEIDPQMRVALELKGWATAMLGDWEDAIAIFKEVHRLTGHPLKGLTPLGFGYAHTGQREKALECIAKMEQRQQEDPEAVMDGDLIVIWWALGNKEKVAYHIEQCITKRMMPFFYLEMPMMKGVKNEPWYGKLRERFGLSNTA
ncbi:MAG TPA: adenylate/guanylate cyclase domain-containing protein [Flavisolibacter sp.]|nr:adenylate/guanylate cyclase domain-containing protein [Flavisolibacter sp.]